MNNVSIGNSGVYFVAGELERRGLTAVLTMFNTRDFDILAINRSNNNQYAIQVKTTTKKDWLLGKKCEDLCGDNIIYVLVKLNKLNAPEYHIIPSSVISETLKMSHQEWLKTPGRNGRMHRGNDMRNYYDIDNKYLDRWDLFK